MHDRKPMLIFRIEALNLVDLIGRGVDLAQGHLE